jgi:L-threonylcarbamoyladenylate synthase
VLSLAGPLAVLLRPGMISQAQIEEVIGPIEVRADAPSGAHPAPGMHRKHYSPATRLLVVDGGDLPPGRGAYLWIHAPGPAERVIQMPDDPHVYAARIYETLHQLDSQGFDWIAAERPPSSMMWAGILDRLERASQPE